MKREGNWHSSNTVMYSKNNNQNNSKAMSGSQVHTEEKNMIASNLAIFGEKTTSLLKI
jgi:hypothetical protein